MVSGQQSWGPMAFGEKIECLCLLLLGSQSPPHFLLPQQVSHPSGNDLDGRLRVGKGRWRDGIVSPPSSFVSDAHNFYFLWLPVGEG
jgi:hypothetical protein